MQWLVDVANVVDYETESERELVSGVWEGCGNLLVVGSLSVVAGVRQHANQRVQCSDQVGGGSLEAVGVAILVPGDVDKVPAGLPTVTHGLDVVGKERALGKGVGAFIGGERRVILFEWREHLKSSS